jgi:Holliday junction resolvase
MPKKTDNNQSQIVDVLRKCGASVFSLHAVGKGMADLLVGINGITYLVEIKSRDGVFTPAQKVFYSEWRGSPVVVLRSVGAAVDWVNSIKRGDAV